MRPTDAQLKNAMTPIATSRLGPTIETSAIAKSRNGKESTTSIERARTVSIDAAEVARRAGRRRRRRRPRASSRRRRRAARSGRRRRPGRARRGRGRRCRTGTCSSGPRGRPSRRQADVAVLLVRARGRRGGDERRDDRESAISTMTTSADDRDPVAAQPRPGELPRAPALDRRRVAARPGRRGRTRSSVRRRLRGHGAPLGDAGTASSSPGLDREVARRRRAAVRSPASVSSGGSSLDRSSGSAPWGSEGGTGSPTAGRSARGRRRQDDPLPAVAVVRIGTAPRRAARWCTGAAVRSKSSSAAAISTILPRYITAIRSLTWRTTERSCAMKT